MTAPRPGPRSASWPAPRRGAATARSSPAPSAPMPTIGARLARATFEPDLLLSDGEALLVAGHLAARRPPPPTWSRAGSRSARSSTCSGGPPARDDGRQPDRPVRQPNISVHRRLRSARRRSCSACAARRATRSTTRPATGCREHSAAVVRRSRSTWSAGVGYDRAAQAGPARRRYHDMRRVVTNLAVFDFGTPDHADAAACRCTRGSTVDEVVAATGFELAVPARRARRPGCPTDEELRSDPRGHRPARPARGRRCRDVTGIRPRCARRSASCSASAYPIVQTGMGWVSGPRLTAATANAGGLGHPRRRDA